MSTPNPVSEIPAAIPWYRSRVLQGILTVIVTQVISRAQAAYHVDLSVLGLNVTDIVSWSMDAISAAAAAYAMHARVSTPLPPVTLTKAAAEARSTEAASASK